MSDQAQAPPPSGSSPQPQPFVVTVVPATPTPERHPGEIIADMLIGSFGVIAGLLMIALVLGGVLGTVRVAWRKVFPPQSDQMPPVSPRVVSPDAGPQRDQAE